MAKTLFDKLWDTHEVMKNDDGTSLLYIDRHYVHEVTSPQAFAGIEQANRQVWRKGSCVAVPDHNVATTLDREKKAEPNAQQQLDALAANCKKHDIQFYHLTDKRQGIVHIIGPEQGYTLPGMTIVCGDSHTSTHGAFATMAIGIGTSEVEHVLATQCLVQKKPKQMKLEVNGTLPTGVTAKDLILYIIGKIGTDGAIGHAIEYCGDTISHLSMEGRMTICNMSIEAGAKCGLIQFDQTTLNYLQHTPRAPKGQLLEQAMKQWQQLHTDPDAGFDQHHIFEAGDIAPQITWGTSPGMVASVNEAIPDPTQVENPQLRANIEHALSYMGLTSGENFEDLKLDKIFIGSCTNARIEDLRLVAEIVKGKQVAKNIKLAMIVPGSGLVRIQAEQEGLDKIFTAAGFEWRLPGCSMCLGMNPDKLEVGERCAATSNRNFEGRQGAGGRTHLVSPAMAAAAAIHGHFVDVRGILA